MHKMKNSGVTILQISDTHLFSHDTEEMHHVNTHEKFLDVLHHIRQNKKINPDLVLLTGDLSQDESLRSYLKLRELVEGFLIPVYWIPGNHDNSEIMSAAFSNSPYFHCVSQLSLKDWLLIFVDTKLLKSDKGYLKKDELTRLEESLAATKKNKFVAIVMHHHPIETKTPLIDKYILRNNAEFWKIVEKYPAVKLIICGHVHGDYHLHYRQIDIETAPATCMQWQKGAKKLEIENKIGYKVYQLDGNSYKSETYLW